MSTVEQQVKKIVAEQLGVKEEEVTNAASFVDDLGADSLDTVELVMALEEEFETEIPDEEAEKITTVQQAINYVSTNFKKGWAGFLARGNLESPTCSHHWAGDYLSRRKFRFGCLGQHSGRQVGHFPDFTIRRV